MSDCLVCKKPDSDRPMCFKNENYCGVDHQKIIESNALVMTDLSETDTLIELHLSLGD